MRKSNRKPIEIGQKFGDWEVVTNEVKKYVGCKCKCGTIKRVYVYHLINGDSTSCGIKDCGNKRGRRKKYLIEDVKQGDVFGKWLIVGNAFYIKSGQQYHVGVEVQCECGIRKIVMYHNLVSGATKGCQKCRLIQVRKVKQYS